MMPRAHWRGRWKYGGKREEKNVLEAEIEKEQGDKKRSHHFEMYVDEHRDTAVLHPSAPTLPGIFPLFLAFH